jgi:YVTN family beta-propeller protein
MPDVQITVIDVPTGSCPTGNSTGGICYGNKYFATINSNNNIAVLVNANTLLYSKQVAVGTYPNDICFGGNYFIITNTYDNNISVIDMITLTNTDTILVGNNSSGICYSPSFSLS